jgi:hypothetical protein
MEAKNDISSIIKDGRRRSNSSSITSSSGGTWSKAARGRSKCAASVLYRRVDGLALGVATTVEAVLGNDLAVQRDTILVRSLGVGFIEGSNGQASGEGLLLFLDQCNHLEVCGIVQAMLGYSASASSRGGTRWSGSLRTGFGPVPFVTTDVTGPRGSSRFGTTTRLGLAGLLKVGLDLLDFSH